MSYKLDKPYTDIQKADFIVEHNHRSGRKIVETQDALYALEPNEIIVDGEVIIDPDYEQKQEQKRKEERNQEIDMKIKELNEMSVPEMLNNNVENLKIYRDVIAGLEAARL